MPHLVAMARAVLMLSPVTIRTVMPARWHLAIASGTCKDDDNQFQEHEGQPSKLKLGRVALCVILKAETERIVTSLQPQQTHDSRHHHNIIVTLSTY